MKIIIKVLAVALLALMANEIKARKLIIRNTTLGSSIGIKQVQITKGGKNLLGKPNATAEFKIGAISGPTGMINVDVINEPFTLQFTPPRGNSFNVMVPQGTADKVIVVDNHGAK